MKILRLPTGNLQKRIGWSLTDNNDIIIDNDYSVGLESRLDNDMLEILPCQDKHKTRTLFYRCGLLGRVSYRIFCWGRKQLSAIENIGDPGRTNFGGNDCLRYNLEVFVLQTIRLVLNCFYWTDTLYNPFSPHLKRLKLSLSAWSHWLA